MNLLCLHVQVRYDHYTVVLAVVLSVLVSLPVGMDRPTSVSDTCSKEIRGELDLHLSILIVCQNTVSLHDWKGWEFQVRVSLKSQAGKEEEMSSFTGKPGIPPFKV